MFEGDSCGKAKANSPVPVVDGVNKFLEQMEMPYSKDATNYRFPLSKMEYSDEMHQKLKGNRDD
mgnify:FL=1